MSKSSYKIAATDLRSFESGRRQGLFFLAFNFFLPPYMYVCIVYLLLFKYVIDVGMKNIVILMWHIFLICVSGLATKDWGQNKGLTY